LEINACGYKADILEEDISPDSKSKNLSDLEIKAYCIRGYGWRQSLLFSRGLRSLILVAAMAMKGWLAGGSVVAKLSLKTMRSQSDLR
jgi:hypothetical protein